MNKSVALARKSPDCKNILYLFTQLPYYSTYIITCVQVYKRTYIFFVLVYVRTYCCNFDLKFGILILFLFLLYLIKFAPAWQYIFLKVSIKFEISLYYTEEATEIF